MCLKWLWAKVMQFITLGVCGYKKGDQQMEVGSSASLSLYE